MLFDTVTAAPTLCPAPAKLNLMLAVVGERADGYHLLESIFTLIDLCDEISVVPRDDGIIRLTPPTPGVAPEQDLIVRAARTLQKHTDCPMGADLGVRKKIPAGGGLGGGSSDAASVLMILNHLWNCRLSRQELMNIGMSLGADVPFFIFGETAFAQGIGERLTPFYVPPKHYVIVFPEVAVSTAEIFAHPTLTKHGGNSTINNLAVRIPRRNDLQEIVLSEYPQVARAFDALARYGEPLMTGSGSCVFLDCDRAEDAQNIVARLRSESFSVFPAQGLSEHPLRRLL